MNQNSNVPYLRPTPQPQYVSIGGEQVKVPDGMTTDEFFELYAQYLEETGQSPPQAVEGDHLPSTREYRPFGEVGEDIDPETLKENEDWLTAASMVHQMVERKPFDGTDEELSDWGREHMAFFNYNLMSTGMNTARVLDADQRTKEAFLYMMDTFDNTKMSWQGTGNAAKEFGKRHDNFLANVDTKAYANELEAVTGISGTDLIQAQRGGRTPGTWAHPKLAVFFARWLDVRFAVACDQMIEARSATFDY